MSVNPLNSYITSGDALYYTKAEVISALTNLSSLSTLGSLFNNPVVSTITINPTGTLATPASITGLALNISSINGQQFGGSGQVQTGSNAGIVSQITPAQGSWQPLVSTSASFSWAQGKLYDIGTNLGLNVYSGPGNGGTLRIGAGLANASGNAQALPIPLAYMKLAPSTSQTLAPIASLRSQIIPNNSASGSIVAYVLVDQPDFVISAQMTNSSNSPAYLQQLN